MFGKCINFIYPPLCPLQLTFYKRMEIRHITKVTSPWWCCGAPILISVHSKIGSGWYKPMGNGPRNSIYRKPMWKPGYVRSNKLMRIKVLWNGTLLAWGKYYQMLWKNCSLQRLEIFPQRQGFFDVSTANNLISIKWVTVLEAWAGKLSRYSDSLRAWGSGDRIPVGARFSALVQTGPGAHPASYTMGTGSFLGVKWPSPGVDHPPTSSAEVKGRAELYLYSLSGPSCPVPGGTLSLLLPFYCIWGRFSPYTPILL
jgi:hypothetical protein